MVASEEHGVAYITDRQGKCYIYDIQAVRITPLTSSKNPPSCRQTINTGSKTIRGLDVDFDSGAIFISCIDDAMIYQYQLSDPESIVSLHSSNPPRTAHARR